MASMDVQFRNPFYHSRLGLLGGAGEESTIYVLDDNEVLPRSAEVVDGVSQDRRDNEKQAAAHKKVADARRQDRADNDEDDEDTGPAKRVRPKEGKAKGDNIPKTRK